MALRIKTVGCESCGGSGKQPAPDAHLQLRVERERVGVSMRSLATAMGKSAGYIGDVERGHRTLTARLAALYVTKLEELGESREGR